MKQSLMLIVLLLGGVQVLSAAGTHGAAAFPKPLHEYADPAGGILDTLLFRAREEPFNVVATLIFLGAILHTFFAPVFMKLAHGLERQHQNRVRQVSLGRSGDVAPEHGSKRAALLHFLGEVEAVFGIWIIPLMIALVFFKGWATAKHYLNHTVNYTEPLFVVVIMIMASSRPILDFATRCLSLLGGTSVIRWWLTLLTVGPLLGSLITEPAAMTICALLLCRKFYQWEPTEPLKYATIALLFVNVSVGGTLTHFAAPPVLMVAGPWGWDSWYMFKNFGDRAIVGIVAVNVLCFLVFRKELLRLEKNSRTEQGPDTVSTGNAVPLWVTGVHALAMVWTVFNSHYPVLFVGGLLFFLAFMTATPAYQSPLGLRTPLLVGFFLAGLVVHGGLQGWWIEPVLGNLGEVPLLLTAAGLTAFNDNALITYLATLVPGLGENLKLAVVSGAVVGGGMTVIANAPNPAGQSILSKFFKGGVNPLKLAAAAFFPTLVMLLAFGLFR
ncbi:MAG: putative Na+/H+ antiporter [Verrucomicrobiae bacterium]|nr:putative Na+/H+ antiporter [Verrucomicrobiae bacterium]